MTVVSEDIYCRIQKRTSGNYEETRQKSVMSIMIFFLFFCFVFVFALFLFFVFAVVVIFLLYLLHFMESSCECKKVASDILGEIKFVVNIEKNM